MLREGRLYSWLKKFVLMAVACACVGSYTVAGAQGTFDVKPDPAKPAVAEQVAPMVGMPILFMSLALLMKLLNT